MFGFDKVAAFTHEFETAFDRSARARSSRPQDLIAVALAAKDHIRALIEEPDADRCHHRRGHPRRPQALRVDPDAVRRAPSPQSPKRRRWPPPRASRPAGSCHLEFDCPHPAQRHQSARSARRSAQARPLLRRAADRRRAVARRARAGRLLSGWEVTLHSDCDKAAIDDVFMFVQDEMELTLEPLEQVEAPRRCRCSSCRRRAPAAGGRAAAAGGRSAAEPRRAARRRRAEAGASVEATSRGEPTTAASPPSASRPSGSTS